MEMVVDKTPQTNVATSSHVQIDSISIDLSSAAANSCDLYSKNSHHFTIRGFVSEVRKHRKDISSISPFISDGETNIATERLYELPDMAAPRNSTSCNAAFSSSFCKPAIEQQALKSRLEEHHPLATSVGGGTLKPTVASAATSTASERCFSYATKMVQYNGLPKKKSSRFDHLPSGHATGRSPSSSKYGYMNGASKQVQYSFPSSPVNVKNNIASPKSAKGRPVHHPSRYACKTSRASVMGPPRSYTERIASAQNKTTKENGFQTGKRHYAKRTSQISDDIEGCGTFFRYTLDRGEVLPSNNTAATKVDCVKLHNATHKSVATKQNIPRTTSYKGKEVANYVPLDEGKICSDDEGKLLSRSNRPNHVASCSSSAQFVERGNKFCMVITNTTGARNTTSEHCVSSPERTNLGCSSSDSDEEDEDYVEELEHSGRRLRPKRPPKIFSLRKVMDKAKHQNVESCRKVKSRKRKREKSSVAVVSGSADSSTSGGSKQVATCNVSRGNRDRTGEIFESALEVSSPSEKISISRMKDMGNDTLDVPDIKKKTKKARTEKIDSPLLYACDKSGKKVGLGKKLKRRRSTDGKEERSNESWTKKKMNLVERKEEMSNKSWTKKKMNLVERKEERSNKSWTKKKIDIVERKEDRGNKSWAKKKTDLVERKGENPTLSKGVQIDGEEVELEIVKDSSLDCIFQPCHNKENVVTENIRDGIATAKITGKGKEILVDEAEAHRETMSDAMTAVEDSSSLPKNDTYSESRGRVKDFDINVPVEEIPMDIVELMAQNQLERARDAAEDKNVIIEDPYTVLNLSLCSTMNKGAVSSDVCPSHSPYRITMMPPTTNIRNGFFQTRPVDSMNRLSESFTHKNVYPVGYPQDSFSSNVRFTECISKGPDHVIDRMHYPSSGSNGLNLGASPGAFNSPINKSTQVASPFTQYQGGMSFPLRGSVWPPVNQRCVDNNQVMFSQGSLPFSRPLVSQRCVPSNLELFSEATPGKNGFNLTHSSCARAVPEYLTHANNKQKITDCLPPTGTRVVDLSSNEAIPALQLLDLMHHSNKPLARDVNRNGYAEILNRSLYEPSRHHQFNKPYRDDSQYELYKSSSGGSSSRIPFYDCSKGTSTSFVQKPCRHSPVHPASNQFVHHPSLFLNNVSNQKKGGVEYGNSFNFPSRDQRGMVENSFWTSQGVDYGAHKQPLKNSSDQVNKNQEWLTSISKAQTTAPLMPFWSTTETLTSKNVQELSLGHGSVAQSGKQGPLLAPNLEVCVVNSNPAEIIDPREASKFTLGPEDFRLCWFTRRPTQSIPKGRGRGRLLKV